MPRRKRTRRLPSTEYGKWHRRHLLTGFSFKGLFGPDFGYGEAFDQAAACAAWGVLREELLLEHITKHPCSRPWAWWHLEPRELRRRTDGGVHPCEAPAGTCPPYGFHVSPWYGLPDAVRDRSEFDALYESVPAYLARLGFLTKAERAHLADNPHLLDPVHACDGDGSD